MKKTEALLIFISLVSLLSCQSRKTSWNDEIPTDTRKEIKASNDGILEAISAGSSEKLKSFFSDSLLKQIGNSFDTTVMQMQKTVSSATYTILDECYIHKQPTNSSDSVIKERPADGSYKIVYDGLTTERFISLLLHESSDGQLLITCIYGKYGNAWKLNTLRIGRYSFFGNTAIDIFHQSKNAYEKGDVTDAANLVALLKQPILPANQFFHYEKEAEIREYSKKVLAEADTLFRFPNVISEIKSEPTLFNIRPLPMQEGIFPVITYGTKLNMLDSLAVKRENESLQKIIGQLFSGIEKNNKYVFFEAFSNKSEIGHIEFVMHGTVNQP